MKKIISAIGFILLILLVNFQSLTYAKDAKADVCRGGENSSRLDFWLGEWEVFADDNQRQGHNLIERQLNGCAIFEHWSGAGGNEGKSLFYYDARDDSWTQIWVTSNTRRTGGLKIKHLIAVYQDGGVRFQGLLRLPDGGSILDRTTLTPLDSGEVRQLIEISKDGGNIWHTSFDAIYKPVDD